MERDDLIYICELNELESVVGITDNCDTPFVSIDCTIEYPNNEYYGIVVKKNKVYGIKA